MAKWHPAHESPTPDPWIVRELKQIDPTLRVVWAMERYLRAEWAIERKMDAERYFLSHASLQGGDRFVDQPVYDHQQPIKDENGNITGHVQVGVRKYDLAPEYEWIAFRPRLDQELITLVRKLYWENAHREETEKALLAEEAQREEAKDKKNMDEALDGVDEAFLETRKVVQFGYGDKRDE